MCKSHCICPRTHQVPHEMVPGPEEVRGCTLVDGMCCRMQGCRFHGDLVGVYMDFMGFQEAHGLYGI